MSRASEGGVINFTPALSSSVVQELDRSLRSTLKNLSKDRAEPVYAHRSERDISGSVHAVERAANLLGSMAARVRELTQTIEDGVAERAALLAERDQLTAQSTLLSQDLAAETERRIAGEMLVQKHEAHAHLLARDLAEAHGNIERLTSVIAAAFGPMESVRDEPNRAAPVRAESA